MTMKTQALTKRLLFEELRGLEPSRWAEVLDFIGYLKYRAKFEPGPARAQEMTARDLLQSDLVGLWADRDDIRDSLSFARQLRWQAEHRWEAADGAA